MSYKEVSVNSRSRRKFERTTVEPRHQEPRHYENIFDLVFIQMIYFFERVMPEDLLIIFVKKGKLYCRNTNPTSHPLFCRTAFTKFVDITKSQITMSKAPTPHLDPKGETITVYY